VKVKLGLSLDLRMTGRMEQKDSNPWPVEEISGFSSPKVPQGSLKRVKLSHGRTIRTARIR